jgi:hypothetical protein
VAAAEPGDATTVETASVDIAVEGMVALLDWYGPDAVLWLYGGAVPELEPEPVL